jgi:hypothetical protein
LYLHCGEKKLIKLEEKTLKKTQVREREREREKGPDPEAHRSVWSRPEFRERERGRERESDRYRER